MYVNVVQRVRDAFMTEDVVRLDCTYVGTSDCKRIGVKLRVDFFSLILTSFFQNKLSFIAILLSIFINLVYICRIWYLVSQSYLRMSKSYFGGERQIELAAELNC